MYFERFIYNSEGVYMHPNNLTSDFFLQVIFCSGLVSLIQCWKPYIYKSVIFLTLNCCACISSNSVNIAKRSDVY